MMQPAAPSVARSAIAGSPAAGCSAWKPRATGPTSRDRNTSLIVQHASVCGDATVRGSTRFGLFTGQVGYAWNNALLYVKGGAAVVADKYDRLLHRLPA